MANVTPLTPDPSAVLVPEQVEQDHHRHVKKEEAHQTSSTEAPKKRIHPNPD